MPKARAATPTRFRLDLKTTKAPSIVTVIGLRDLTKAAQLVTSKTYGGFMALFGVALCRMVCM